MFKKIYLKINIRVITSLIIWLVVNASCLSYIGTIAGSISTTEEPGTSPRANTIISTDTTWTIMNSPYNLSGNVLVEHNAALTIDPGVEIRLNKDNYFQIEGKLLAEGTANKMIKFTSIKTNPPKSDYWDSIKFMSNANYGSSIKYSNFQYGREILINNLPSEAAPNITYCNIPHGEINYIVQNSIIPSINPSNIIAFNNITGRLYLETDKANVLVQENKILNGLFLIGYYSNVNIKNNYIYNNDENGWNQWKFEYGNLKISNNTIIGEYGIKFHGIYYSNVVITNNSISAKYFSNIDLGTHSFSNSVITKNLIIGTTKECIGISGTIYSNNSYPFNINNNTIIYTNIGIKFYDEMKKIDIKHNTIANNEYGISIPGDFPVSSSEYIIQNNNIYNNSKYGIHSNIPKTGDDLDLTNNWWGTTNASEINQSIYDYYDDFNLGKVIYKPFLTKKVKIYEPYNLPPIADVGPDQNVLKSDWVYFDWSKSSDPNNFIVLFTLDFGDGNSTGWKEYFIPQSYNQSYHVYERFGNYTVTLTVFDGLLYDTDTCLVNVSKLIIPNYPPSLHLPTVEIPEDSYLQQYYDLWEYAADDRTPVEWLNFSIVNITNPKCGVILESKRYITIKPAVNWHGNATVTIRVDDGELNSTIDFKIIVYPVREPPMADTGGDYYAKLNTTVTFDGSGSVDNDGDSLIYNWSFGDGTYSGWLNSSNTTHLYNKTGIYKVKLTVNDSEFNAIDFCTVWIYSNDTSLPPVIKDIWDIHIHYYSPETRSESPGYSYDFSYFINDPDNAKSELTLIAVPVEPNLTSYIENDPNNNLQLIFKFPFELVDGKKHPVKLYVKDLNPRATDASQMFNITVVIDTWPVELIQSIPRQSFDEDNKLDDAINLRDYFYDKDGGTTYEVLNQNTSKVRGDIDQDNNLDLYSNEQNFTGTEEVVIHAHDTQPEQDVYAVVRVKVNPVNDPPEISEIPKLVVQVDSEEILNLEDYIYDVDTDFSELIIESSDPEHVKVNGNYLEIEYNKVGDYTVTITTSDGEFTISYDLKISVLKNETIPTNGTPINSSDSDGDGLPDLWEVKYGLNPNDNSDAVLDLDNDSLTNLEEYWKDTDPTLYDTDGDGYSDKVDDFPNDPGSHKKESKDEKVNQTDQIGYISVILLVVIIIVMLLISIYIIKNRSQSDVKFTPDDEIYSKVIHDILFDYQPNGEKLSNIELEAILDERLQKGEISEESYNYTINIIHNMEQLTQENNKYDSNPKVDI